MKKEDKIYFKKKIENKKIEQWIMKNGCVSIDTKNKDIIIHDGGLFGIDAKKVRRHKIVGFEPIKVNMNGKKQLSAFKPISSKKTYVDYDYSATVWFTELRETINYLQRLERFLNGLGYETKPRIKKKTQEMARNGGSDKRREKPSISCKRKNG